MAEIDAACVLHRRDKVLDRSGVVVVAPDIEIHAAAKPLLADQRMDHAHQFGAFVVDSRRVEIVDPYVAVRPHRVGERAVILGKLNSAQRAHLGDAPHRAAPLIGGKLLVAEYGQPFL